MQASIKISNIHGPRSQACLECLQQTLAVLFRVVACVIVSAGVRRSQLVDAAGGTGAFVKQPLQSVPPFRAEPNGRLAAVIVTLGQLSWCRATQSDGHRSPIVSFHTRECLSLCDIIITGTSPRPEIVVTAGGLDPPTLSAILMRAR